MHLSTFGRTDTVTTTVVPAVARLGVTWTRTVLTFATAPTARTAANTRAGTTATNVRGLRQIRAASDPESVKCGTVTRFLVTANSSVTRRGLVDDAPAARAGGEQRSDKRRDRGHDDCDDRDCRAADQEEAPCDRRDNEARAAHDLGEPGGIAFEFAGWTTNPRLSRPIALRFPDEQLEGDVRER